MNESTNWKQEALELFREWSGGREPDECEGKDIFEFSKKYAHHFEGVTPPELYHYMWGLYADSFLEKWYKEVADRASKP